jgi:pyrophosphatase PpaX
VNNIAYSTILFDLDGTLIDTNELIFASFEHAFEIHCPNTYTRADILPIMGEPLADQMHHFDPTQAEAMVNTYRQFNESEHDRYVSLFPHVADCLSQLHQQGIKMGVISNKRRQVVEQGLQLFQLDQWMSVVICEGEAERNKPYPDMLLLALEKLEANTATTLMVGDSRFDIIAAQRANIDSVGVAWSLHSDDIKQHQPTYWINDIRELLSLIKKQ